MTNPIWYPAWLVVYEMVLWYALKGAWRIVRWWYGRALSKP